MPETHQICTTRAIPRLGDGDKPSPWIRKQFDVSGELSGRVGLSQLPAPSPELVGICKACLHCQSKTESSTLEKSR